MVHNHIKWFFDSWSCFWVPCFLINELKIWLSFTQIQNLKCTLSFSFDQSTKIISTWNIIICCYFWIKKVTFLEKVLYKIFLCISFSRFELNLVLFRFVDIIVSSQYRPQSFCHKLLKVCIILVHNWVFTYSAAKSILLIKWQYVCVLVCLYRRILLNTEQIYFYFTAL